METLNYPERKQFEKVANTVLILNGTHIIEVNGKVILVVAGTPTEQTITIKIIIEICLKIKVKIDFAIVSLRTSERMNGYNTRDELAKFGQCILEERIWKIESEDFKETAEWKKRIEKIVDLIDTK